MWFKTGEFERSLPPARSALALDPGNEGTLAIVSEIFRRLGDTEGAINLLRDTSRTRPESVIAASRLAWLLSTTPRVALRDPSEAVRIMEGVMDVIPDPDASVLDALAASYAAEGRFEDAARVGEQATARAERDGLDKFSNQIRQRVLLYREGRPFYDES